MFLQQFLCFSLSQTHEVTPSISSLPASSCPRCGCVGGLGCSEVTRSLTTFEDVGQSHPD